jgi:basic membrane protein A and related proteins
LCRAIGKYRKPRPQIVHNADALLTRIFSGAHPRRTTCRALLPLCIQNGIIRMALADGDLVTLRRACARVRVAPWQRACWEARRWRNMIWGEDMRNLISKLATIAVGSGLLFGLGMTAIAADPPLKVAFVYLGPVGDGGWTFQHDLGRIALQKEFGDKVKTTFVENVPETADAERVIRQLAADGNQLIFTTSFGYMEPTLKVAKQFPKVKFEHATGYKTAPNLATYQPRFYEGAYLLGVLAGKLTKTNTLGFVGSFPIPEVIRNIDAYTLGALSVNPKIKTKVIWVNTWYDPGKERQAAETLVAQGADMLAQNTDSPAVVQVAQEKGINAFGWDSDMAKYGPKAELTANTQNWGVYYISQVKKVFDGTWKSGETSWGIKEGMVVLTALNASVPPDVAKLFNEKKQAIIDGKLILFAGPLKDNKGAMKIPAGQEMPFKDLMAINWYIEGVEGSIPK